MSRPTAYLRRLSAPLLTLVLGLTTLPALLVVATPAPAQAAPSSFTGGTVSWGIKASWRRYIGTGSQAGDGATVDGWDGNTPTGFTFPIESGTFDPATSTTTLDLGGYVHFQQWYGVVQPDKYALDTKYSELTLTIGPDVQEIRGNHTGYLRSDAGGELHEDVDVVLASFDVSAATTDFAADRTRWTDIPTVAGEGFRIYSAGSAIDPVSIDYPGPGGLPDLEERFAQPGVPVLAPAGRWSTGTTTSGSSGTGRSLVVSPRGDVVYGIQVSPQTSNNLVVQALDATTLAPVGTPYLQPLPTTGTTQRFIRTAVDPATDTLFYLTGRDGTGGNEVTAHALTYDRDTTSFLHRTVGSVVVATTGTAVGGVAWNAVDQELAVVLAASASTTTTNPPRLVRFTRAGDDWSVTDTPISLGATDTFPGGQACSCNLVLSTAASSHANLAVLGDGSYLLATGTATLSAGTPRPYVPAQHLVVGADGTLTATSVPGTEAVAPATGATYGRGLAAPGPDGTVYLHGDGQNQDDIQQVRLVDGVAVAGDFIRGPDAYPDLGLGLSLLGASVAYDAQRDLLWALDTAVYDGTAVKLIGETGAIAGYSVPDLPLASFGQPSVVVGVDGSLYVPIREVANGPFGFERLAFEGIAPAVTEQPEDVGVDLAVDEPSRDVTFEAAVDTELGGDLQWQVRLPGASRFTDVADATAETLSVPASPTTDGRTYRVVVTNEAGRVASAEADLTVTYAPRLTTQPRDVRVTEGSGALLTAEAIGNPALSALTWQRRVGGFWEDVTPDDELAVDTVDGVSTLRLAATATDQSGARFRLKAASPAGTTYSRAAVLTVDPEVVVPPEGLTLEGAVLDWTGSEELQSAPPFGGNNYFSAGTSDGTRATYLAAQGDVAVLQVAADGTEAPATWVTRADHVENGGGQLVRLSGGDAHLRADGSARIAWDGAWSVNFYGGLLPFTITDPELVVAADGTGELVGDLTGYAGSMDNPEVKTPMPPVPDVTIATFAGVEVDAAGRVEITPEYDGRAIDVPAGVTAQDRTSAGWGAWPQEFVDVHFVTGLSSYWYSSGGAADPKKRPAPFAVDLADATEVDEPDPATDVASTTTVRLSRPSVAYGKPASAIVAVTAPGVTPAGPVTVRVGEKSVTGTLAGGRATVALPAGLRPGAVEVTASYAGQPGVTGSAGRADLRVTKAAPKVRLVLPRAVASSKRAQARLRVVLPGVRPAGQLVIREGRDVVAVVTLKASAGGRVSVRLPRLAKGRHHLRATLGGSELVRSSTSPYRTLLVR